MQVLNMISFTIGCGERSPVGSRLAVSWFGWSVGGGGGLGVGERVGHVVAL